jgi:chemotaxis protein MotB
MAVKKKKQASGGAPEWMVTFGDMMSLLLCFFVILVSMSEIKEDQRYQKVMESIKRAFGYEGGAGFISSQSPPANTNQQELMNLIMRKFQLQVGKSSDQGIEGENPSVKTVREGLEFTIGGQVSFEIGKAKLLEGGKEQLGIFSETIRGMNTKIRIRGHTARIPASRYQPFSSLDELTYARALAVKEYMVGLGINSERMTVEACRDNEPLRIQAYDEESRSVNDRVSIIVTESLVENFSGKPEEKSKGIIDG